MFRTSCGFGPTRMERACRHAQRRQPLSAVPPCKKSEATEFSSFYNADRDGASMNRLRRVVSEKIRVQPTSRHRTSPHRLLGRGDPHRQAVALAESPSSCLENLTGWKVNAWSPARHEVGQVRGRDRHQEKPSRPFAGPTVSLSRRRSRPVGQLP